MHGCEKRTSLALARVPSVPARWPSTLLIYYVVGRWLNALPREPLQTAARHAEEGTRSSHSPPYRRHSPGAVNSPRHSPAPQLRLPSAPRHSLARERRHYPDTRRGHTFAHHRPVEFHVAGIADGEGALVTVAPVHLASDLGSLGQGLEGRRCSLAA